MPRVRFPIFVLSVFALLLWGCGGGGLPSSNLGGGGGGDTPADVQVPPAGTTQMSAAELSFAMQVLDLTNQERTSRGLNALTWHDGAAQVAFDHSIYQRALGCIDHTGSGGTSPGDRLDNAQIGWTRAAENVAVGYTTPQLLVEAWMNSSGHRANILNPDLTHLGVGIEEGVGGQVCSETGRLYGGPWATQAFFTPR